MIYCTCTCTYLMLLCWFSKHDPWICCIFSFFHLLCFHQRSFSNWDTCTFSSLRLIKNSSFAVLKKLIVFSCSLDSGSQVTNSINIKLYKIFLLDQGEIELVVVPKTIGRPSLAISNAGWELKMQRCCREKRSENFTRELLLLQKFPFPFTHYSDSFLYLINS